MVVHDCNKQYLQPLTKNSIFNLIFTIFREPKPPLHSGCKDRMLMHKKTAHGGAVFAIILRSFRLGFQGNISCRFF